MIYTYKLLDRKKHFIYENTELLLTMEEKKLDLKLSQLTSTNLKLETKNKLHIYFYNYDVVKKIF